MIKAHFESLFKYTNHSNGLAIELLKSYKDKLPESTFITFSHILNAHHIWIARIRGEKEQYKVWDIHNPEQMEIIDKQNYLQSISVIEDIPLEKTISYKTSKGLSYQSEVKDILFHIVNHSTYHRGQVMANIRAAGLEPVPTDYIFYKR